LGIFGRRKNIEREGFLINNFMTFNDLVLLVEGDDNIEIARKYWDVAKKKPYFEIWYNPELGDDGDDDNEPLIYYHRLDGPAEQVWYKNGQKQYEWWYKDGKCHRLDGPAVQRWDENGNKIGEEYFINDKELTPNEFKQLTKQYDKEDMDVLNDLNT
jgi:hypothetical protein